MIPRIHRALVCAVLLALVATGCRSSGEGTEARRSTPVPEKVVHPLTGIETEPGQAWESRPALALKLGNAPPERPQAGLDKADLVYEEIVEGGTTRFMAVFSTNDAGRVGPIRSARKVDPTLLAPLNALFGYSGGAPSTIRVLQAASGFTDVGINRASGAYHRDSNRRSPYNLYTSTSELWAGRNGGSPKQHFTFLKASDDPGTGSQEAATNVRLSFAGNGSEIHYAYDMTEGTYTRNASGSPHTAEGGAPLTYRNIVVPSVEISAGYSIDKAGFRTFDVKTVGSGSVVVFRGGKAFRGTWERATDADPWRFTDESGRVIPLAPGNSIIELLPQGRPVTVG
ncbi:MAG: DUF3048 domain-containing protein [Actinomycetota bacterium]